VKIHALQHVPFEGLGHIAAWAKALRYPVSVTRMDLGDPYPVLDELDCLIILGGPMNIYEEDRFPWLGMEKRFIAQAIAAHKKVLGICLGSQLIADVLGAKVYAGKSKEIGWFPIQITAAGRTLFTTLPADLTVFHWHGDTFEMPAGAIHIATSAACPNQAFLFDNHVLGLQFHLEATPASVQALVENCGDELVEGPFIQTAGEILGQTDMFTVIHRVMGDLLEHFVAASAR